MATSSIFASVKIDTPEKAKAFVAALEASEKDRVKRLTPKHSLTTDSEVLLRMSELRKKKRESR